MKPELIENEVELELTYGDVTLTLDKRTDVVTINTTDVEYSVLNKLMKALKKAHNRPQVGELDD